MAGIAVYRTGIAADWIDYNGHLRDAYYGLIVSLGLDALMERIGLDQAYRARTACTLYTLEMHMHYLREVKGDATVTAEVRILGADRKRIHAALRSHGRGTDRAGGLRRDHAAARAADADRFERALPA